VHPGSAVPAREENRTATANEAKPLILGIGGKEQARCSGEVLAETSDIDHKVLLLSPYPNSELSSERDGPAFLGKRNAFGNEAGLSKQQLRERGLQFLHGSRAPNDFWVAGHK